MDKSQELINQIAQKESELSQMRNLLKEEQEKNKPKPITDQVMDYSDILKIGNYDESKDVININGFSDEENRFVELFVKKVRIAKVYRQGAPLAKRGESRWYPWYNVSSGFVFRVSLYVDVSANVASAARLCFKNEDLVKDYDAKFRHIEEEFIGLGKHGQ